MAGYCPTERTELELRSSNPKRASGLSKNGRLIAFVRTRASTCISRKAAKARLYSSYVDAIRRAHCSNRPCVSDAEA